MDRPDADIEAIIRNVNDLIPNPDDRMSEIAIQLMVKVVVDTIDAMESETIALLTERGLAARKTG